MTKVPICFLVVDNDSNQKEIIENEVLKKLNFFDIFYKFYNTKDFFIENGDKFSFSYENFLRQIEIDTKGQSINLIAIDFNLNDNIKGIDIIHILKEKSNKNLKNCHFLIHSASLKTASSRLVEEINNANADSIEKLNHIIESKITISSKSNYPSEIVNILKTSIDLKAIIINVLNKLEITEISYGNDEFDGSKISKIIELIVADDIKGNKFIVEILNLAISNFGQINE